MPKKKVKKTVYVKPQTNYDNIQIDLKKVWMKIKK